MRNIKRLAAGALTIAAVLAPAAPALADTPYAQASVLVKGNGSTVGVSKNVTETRRVRTGFYCVVVDDDVDMTGSVAVHVTAVGLKQPPRWLSIGRQSPGCREGSRSITVRSVDLDGHPADSAFVLTVS